MRAMFISATIVVAVIAAGCGVTRSSTSPQSPAPTPGASEAPARFVQVMGEEGSQPMTLQIFDRSQALTNARTATPAELKGASDEVGNGAIEAASLAGGRQMLLLWVGYTCAHTGGMFIEPGVNEIVIAPELKTACDAMGTTRGVVLEFKLPVDLTAVHFDLRTATVSEPTDSPEPTATPNPKPTATASPKPTPKPVVLTANEKFLLAGLRKEAKVKCEARRTSLPARAIAGIECTPRKDGVERVGVYLFKSEAAMVATYKERMAQEGVKLNTGSCYEGEGENSYFPGEIDADVIERQGCFFNQFGIANYRATVPSGPAIVGLLGTSANTRALEDYVWKFNQDVPGVPTIWQGLHTGP